MHEEASGDPMPALARSGAWPCTRDSTQPPAAQCPEEPFGAPGWCRLRESPTGPPTNCLPDGG